MRFKMILGVLVLSMLCLAACSSDADAGLTNFPNGITSFGAPVLPDNDGQIWGTTYFVSTDTSVAGDSNDGLGRDTPLLTIQAAINKCTTGKGDRIYVQNGAYTEDLTITKDDITIIGQSASDTIITGATDATDVLIVTGNEVTIKNLQFDGFDTGSDISLIKVGTTGTATSGIQIVGCKFVGNEYHIEVLDSADMLIHGNAFITLDDVTDGACVNLSNSDSVRVLHNLFSVDANSDGILHKNSDHCEVAYNIAIGDDDTGASAGAFVLINGVTATDTLSVHDNTVTLFGAVVAEVGANVAAHGLGTADLNSDSSLTVSGGVAHGCTVFFDSTGLT